jgi:hypothetical protein
VALRRLALSDLPKSPASVPAITKRECEAFARRLDAAPADLIFALDPPALAVAHAAVKRARARGFELRLAYDRSQRPAPGSRYDDLERTTISHVDAATVASIELAQDERWPSTLQEPCLVYSSPVGLASSPARFAQLGKALKGKRRPRVGLFLPSMLSTLNLREVRLLLRSMPDSHMVVFGSRRQLASLALSWSVPARGVTMQALPDADDLPQVMDYLDIVVCPSVWHRERPPSSAAIAGATKSIALVASHAVTEELAWGSGTTATSARAVSEAVRRANGSNLPNGARESTRPTLGYGRQVAALRGLFDAVPVRRLGIGPRNGNGQAWAWAQSVRAIRPNLAVEVFAAGFSSGRLAMTPDADLAIPLESWQQREWQLWWAHRLRVQFSDLLIEQGLATCGWLNGKAFYDDLPSLLDSGINVGLVFRGSEIRDPAGHANRERWSPFHDPAEPLTAKLQSLASVARHRLEGFDVPKFVTTLDLLDDVPHAMWLPQVLDVEAWAPGPDILRRRRPVVLHAPSRNESMKGSHWVDDACQPLHDAGVIEYQRLRGVPFAEMPGRIRAADIVIDQLALGSYGVLALQAMATQRLVVGHVNDRVRGRLNEPLPILQAEPTHLRTVLEEAIAAPDWARSLAHQGRDYVCRYHSGQASAARLLGHLVDQEA